MRVPATRCISSSSVSRSSSGVILATRRFARCLVRHCEALGAASHPGHFLRRSLRHGAAMFCSLSDSSEGADGRCRLKVGEFGVSGGGLGVPGCVLGVAGCGLRMVADGRAGTSRPFSSNASSFG